MWRTSLHWENKLKVIDMQITIILRNNHQSLPIMSRVPGCSKQISFIYRSGFSLITFSIFSTRNSICCFDCQLLELTTIISSGDSRLIQPHWPGLELNNLLKNDLLRNALWNDWKSFSTQVEKHFKLLK